MNLAAMLVLATLTAQGPTEEACQNLARLVSANDLRETAKAALDAPPSCASSLAPHLAVRESSYLAAYALAMMADPVAQDMLYEQLARNENVGLKTLAAVGAGAVARPKDVAFLCASLKGDQIGTTWPPIEAAALSLGLLRSTECKQSLTKAASVEGSIAGDAARHALRAIEAKPSCSATAADDEWQSAVTAVLSCDVPRSEKATAFYENQKHRIWHHSSGGWAMRPAEKSEGNSLPSIALSVVFSQNHKRALVSVGMMFGPLNGKGYDYLVAREGGKWQVKAIESTWIS